MNIHWYITGEIFLLLLLIQSGAFLLIHFESSLSIVLLLVPGENRIKARISERNGCIRAG